MKPAYAVVTIEIGALKVKKALTFEEVEQYITREAPLRHAFDQAMAELQEVFTPPAGKEPPCN